MGKGGRMAASEVEVLQTSVRQYCEAHSHAQQIREHFRLALVDVVQRAERLEDAKDIALQALDNPPAWDGRLR